MAINLNDNVSVLAPKPSDARYGPFSSVGEAVSSIPVSFRFRGLSVGVEGPEGIEEYWFQNGTLDEDLVPKTGGGDSFWLDNDGGVRYPETVSIGTESKSEKLNVEGNVNLSERVVYGTKEITGEEFLPGAFVYLSFEEFSAFDFRSIEFTVQAEARGEKIQISKIMCTHNLFEAFYNEYGEIHTNGRLLDLSVSLGFKFINLAADIITPGIEKVTIHYEAVRAFDTSDVTSSFIATWKNCTNLTSLNLFAPI